MDPKDASLTTICEVLGSIGYKNAVAPYLVSPARNPESSAQVKCRTKAL